MITQAAGSVGYAKQRWGPVRWKNRAKVHRRRVLRIMRMSKSGDDDLKNSKYIKKNVD